MSTPATSFENVLVGVEGRQGGRDAIALARELGVCGEHGGDPDSIRFFNKAGRDYVSCSPFRVPIARVSAAQAAIEGRGLTEDQRG